MTEEQIKTIVAEISRKFHCFSGGFEISFDGPIHKDKGPAFAAGVDVEAVVRFIVNKQEQLETAAEQLLLAFAKADPERGEGGKVDWDDVSTAMEYAKDALPGRYEAILAELKAQDSLERFMQDTKA